jgi:hypothetical protein
MRLPEPVEPPIARLVVDRRLGNDLRADLDRVIDGRANRAGGAVDVFERQPKACRRKRAANAHLFAAGLIIDNHACR